jgi:hypothetical protein
VRAVRYVDDASGHVEVVVYDVRVIEVVDIVDYDEPVVGDPVSPRAALWVRSYVDAHNLTPGLGFRGRTRGSPYVGNTRRRR